MECQHLVLDRIGTFHARRAHRHSRHRDTADIVRLIRHQLPDEICGYVALYPILADHRRVAGTEAARYAGALAYGLRILYITVE